MRGLPDISTIALSRTRLKLREDLVFVPQLYGDETYYHIEVKSTSEYFRTGFAEYVFISLLDGQTSFSEALAIASQKLREKALSQSHAMTLYSWLLEHGLAAFADQESAASGASSGVGSAKKSDAFRKKFNLLWLQVPLGRPEAVLRAIEPLCGWLFSLPATVASLMLMGFAGMLLKAHGDEFIAASSQVIARDNWLWLLAVWILLKVIHEAGHGLVCRRYGGSIREMGIIFAFFAPLAYVDASSSWSFRSRWQRIHTALAGIYVELTLAAIAALMWIRTDSVLLRHLLQNVICMAGVSTLLFNLNPLMKFDGYYVVADLLQIPNLSRQSLEALRCLTSRILCGTSGPELSVPGRQRWVLVAWGMAMISWRLLICVSLLIAASVLFHGAGLALAAVGVLIWFGPPVFRIAVSIRNLREQQPERLLRAIGVSAAVMLVAATALTTLPAPVMTTAPGIIDLTDAQIIRAVTPGFVDQVRVRDGQEVEAGQILLILRNDVVIGRLADLTERVTQEHLRLRTASHDHDSGGQSISAGNLASLSKQLEECRREVEGLQLRADRKGRVISRDLSLLAGTYAETGKELLTIGFDDEKEVRLSVGQRELPVAAALVGQPLRIRIGTRSAVTGTLERVNPRASRSVPHPALSAVNGGPLPVVPADNADNQSAADERLRLLDFRFTAVVRLSAEDSVNLRCGERCRAALGLPPVSLGRYLCRCGHDWFERQFAGLKDAN